MLDLQILTEFDDTLTLGISYKSRLVFFGIALFLAWGMMITQTLALPAAIIMGISFLAGFYTEVWVFDRHRQQIKHTYGLIFLNRKKHYNITDIESIKVRNSAPIDPNLQGSSRIVSTVFSGRNNNGNEQAESGRQPRFMQKGISSLVLLLNSGEKVNVNTASIKKSEEQKTLAQAIAKACQKSFTIE